MKSKTNFKSIIQKLFGANNPTDNCSGQSQDEIYRQLEKENKLVLSYLTVRKIIGILGILFPLILVLGSLLLGQCKEIQLSISNYYHTNMRDVFVGYVCTLSIFLLSYKGYDLTDRIVSALAGIFGLIVALFPTSLKLNPDNSVIDCNIWCNVETHQWIGQFHLTSAGLFIVCLCYFSLFLFTKGESTPTPQKIRRNKIYKVCGYIMLACIILLIAFFLLPDSLYQSLVVYKPVFWLETIAFIAFGFSWLVKGKFLFID